MIQSLHPLVNLEDVVSVSRVLLVLFRRADPLGSEQHYPGLGTKAHTLGPGSASSLQTTWNLL